MTKLFMKDVIEKEFVPTVAESVELERLRDLCHRAATWVEDVKVASPDAEREKAIFVGQLYEAGITHGNKQI